MTRLIFKPRLLLPVCTSLLAALPVSADDKLEEIFIIGVREDRSSKGATGLDLSPFETPQSVSILDSETLDQFQLNNINDTLNLVTGVNVERSETDRTYYNARGFDITSMHVDGVGIPFANLVIGELDTAVYEKVEIIRGANGLITGIGNPSGTINYVRKRPLNEFQLTAKVAGGSWNKKRLETDLSTPITADGRWAARAVVAVDDRDSWLDLYEHQQQTFYGIVDGQIGSNTTLAMGYTHQKSLSDGVLWGALPLTYTDGTQADYDVSTTTTMDWTYWDAITDTAFVELGIQLGDHWNLLSTITHSESDQASQLFYVWLSPGLDPVTHLGAQSYPGKYDDINKSIQWDTNINGQFEFAGLEHQLSIGLSIADQDVEARASDALAGFEALPPFPGWQGNEVAEPPWAEARLAADSDIKLNRFYGALRLAASENFHAVLGFNVVDFQREGISYDVSTDSDDQEISPYLGFTWTIQEGLNAYASYSDIYQPQYELNTQQLPLGPAQGKSSEAGLKKEWFNGKLLTSIALFQTEQSNLAEFIAYTDCDDIPDDDTSDDFECAPYRGITAESDGFEIEVAGQPADTLKIQAGYTNLSIKDPNGNDSRTFIPRKSFKLLTTWDPAVIENLSLGLSTRWQDDIENNGMSQDAYVLLGLFADYEITESVKVGINLDNITDKKYFNGLQWDQTYYGAPRTTTVRMSYSM